MTMARCARNHRRRLRAEHRAPTTLVAGAHSADRCGRRLRSDFELRVPDSGEECPPLTLGEGEHRPGGVLRIADQHATGDGRELHALSVGVAETALPPGNAVHGFHPSHTDQRVTSPTSFLPTRPGWK